MAVIQIRSAEAENEIIMLRSLQIGDNKSYSNYIMTYDVIHKMVRQAGGGRREGGWFGTDSTE